MRTLTIRLYEDTIQHIQKAAYSAGVPKAAFIRYRLEQIFDGTPHNPLGVYASPPFYTELAEAMAVISVMKLNFDGIDQELAKRKAMEIRKMIEIDYSH